MNNNKKVTAVLRERKEEILELARSVYRDIFGKKPPRISDPERLMLVKCAYLAIEWGETWLREAARARPAGQPAHKPMAFFRAAAAYTAWEHLTGDRAETHEERMEARKGFKGLLKVIDVPAELTERQNHVDPPN